jgi:hypothetical protein
MSFVMSVRLTVCMEQLDSHWTDFREICHYKIFRKSVEKILLSLKSDKTNGCFTFLCCNAVSDTLHEDPRTFHYCGQDKFSIKVLLCNARDFYIFWQWSVSEENTQNVLLFPLQQWLRNRGNKLLYACIAYLVEPCIIYHTTWWIWFQRLVRDFYNCLLCFLHTIFCCTQNLNPVISYWFDHLRTKLYLSA